MWEGVQEGQHAKGGLDWELGKSEESRVWQEMSMRTCEKGDTKGWS
jgi:hypothetical protein